MTPTEPPPMDQNVSFLEFAKAYYPQSMLTEEQAQQIEEVCQRMCAAGNPVTREYLLHLLYAPRPAPPFTPDPAAALLAFAEKSYKDPTAFLQPAKAEKKKRWETPAAYAKRMRKRR